MLSNRALRNFDTYLAVTPSRDLGRPPNQNPAGAYDSARRGGHGFGIDTRSFDRGGGLDFEGETIEKLLAFLKGKGYPAPMLAKVESMLSGNGRDTLGGERNAGGVGERYANRRGERDQAEDDDETAEKLRQWCGEHGLTDGDAGDLLRLLGVEADGEAQLQRNREQLDNMNAMDARHIRPASNAARAAFDAAHGIAAARPRLLG